jgi:hypothetical protein
MNAKPALCYLCGQPLSEPVSMDHVPMLQLFDSEIRKAHSPNLLTIPVHDQSDFDPRPGGLVLPGNQVVQRFDGDRLRCVAWKIVRGLYFHHQNKCLPKGLITGVTLTPPDQEPPDHFKAFMSLPDNEPDGRYPAVFDYRFQNVTEGQTNAHYWAMLLWDRIIITVVFHDPACHCDGCQHMKVC